MSRKTPILLLMVLLASFVFASTTSAQTPPGTPSRGSGPNPDSPGGYDTPRAQPFEEFTIRLEPALGSPRCPVTQQDAAHCDPVGWLSTRSQEYVNIRGEAILRGSNEVPQGVQVTSSFVASQDDTNVALQFSAEAYVEDDNPGAGRRMFVRALVDGVAVDPLNVVFAKTGHQGTQSFIFTTNVDAGIHTVEIQWKIDSEATGYLRDASLLVRMGMDQESPAGTFSVKTPPSGPNQSTTKASWKDIPDMALTVYSPKGGQVTASFSAEAWASAGSRFLLRATIDGNPMTPGDVVFVKNDFASSQAMTFGIGNVSSGLHTVKMQWLVDGGGTAYAGDRSLAVSALPVGVSHVFVAAPSGANVHTPKEVWAPVELPDMEIKFEIPAKGNGEVAVQFSAEVGATDDAVVMAGLEIDGELQLDGYVQLADGSQGAQVRSFVFEAKGLAPGPHTAKIVYGSDTSKGGTAYAGDRTMNLMSETGFIPDLAEAPVFSGGHIGVDSDRIAGIEPLIGTRKVLTVLIDPKLCEGTWDIENNTICYNQYTIPKGKVDSAVFGSSTEPGWGVFQLNNIASYYSSTSGGRFSIERAGPGIAGWFTADKPSEAYYEHDGTCTDGYDDGGLMLIGEAVRKADPTVNFASFDINSDGKLNEQELAIVVVHPRLNGDGSSVQELYASTCDGPNTRLVLDGVELPDSVAKWNTSLDDAQETYQFTTGAHELLHVIGGLDDMYHGKEDLVSAYPGDLSIMSDGRWTTAHLDPFMKMALGWVTPLLVDESTQITVQPVAKSNTVFVLPRYNNPWDEEFYILENRIADLGVPYYDDNISDSGIGVWHIVSDPETNVLAPVGTHPDIWDESHASSSTPTSLGQMTRNGIRLIRPFDDVVDGNPVFNTTDRLWAKNDYDLNSGTCLLIAPVGEQHKNRLSWADCEASGYSLSFLDFAIEAARVKVTVP